MRTITKQVELYKFDELSEQAKENAVYELSQGNSYLIEEDINCYLSECLNLDYSNLEYSLSYSQGDGVCFILNALKVEHIENSPYFKGYKKSHLKYFCENFPNIVTFTRVNFHYSHENTYSVEFNEFNFIEYFTNNHRVTLFTEKLHDLVNDFADYYKDLQMSIYDKAVGFADYYSSYEYINEFCEINGYEFTIDGKLN